MGIGTGTGIAMVAGSTGEAVVIDEILNDAVLLCALCNRLTIQWDYAESN